MAEAVEAGARPRARRKAAIASEQQTALELGAEPSYGCATPSDSPDYHTHTRHKNPFSRSNASVFRTITGVEAAAAGEARQQRHKMMMRKKRSLSFEN